MVSISKSSGGIGSKNKPEMQGKTKVDHHQQQHTLPFQIATTLFKTQNNTHRRAQYYHLDLQKENPPTYSQLSSRLAVAVKASVKKKKKKSAENINKILSKGGTFFKW